MSIRIVLVDDHRMFREGVRNMLDQQADMEVVGEAEDGRAAAELVRELSPHVVVMDVTMPNLNGIDATCHIVTEHAGVKVIALSMHAHQRFVQEMLKAGASGYLLKECAVEELVQAVHVVVDDGQIYLSPEITRVVVDDYLEICQKEDIPDAPLLTAKEREILQLVAEGDTSEQIAQTLCMSRRTVEKHRSSIMGKLKTRSMADLIKYAIRKGLTKV